MKRRTAAERNQSVEAHRRKAVAPAVAITGVEDVDPDVIASAPRTTIRAHVGGR